VSAVRRLLAQRHLAVLLCAATLLLKLMVPTGYMIDTDHGRIAITVCAGTAPHAMAMNEAGEGAGAHDGMPGHGKSKNAGKAEMPCAFSGLSAAVLAPVDPVQLAALFAFIRSAGVAGTPLPPPFDPGFLRPPLRGPPANL
jgi:hypothetical protein